MGPDKYTLITKYLFFQFLQVLGRCIKHEKQSFSNKETAQVTLHFLPKNKILFNSNPLILCLLHLCQALSRSREKAGTPTFSSRLPQIPVRTSCWDSSATPSHTACLAPGTNQTCTSPHQYDLEKRMVYETHVTLVSLYTDRPQ